MTVSVSGVISATAAQWAATSTPIAKNQMTYETDTGLFKVGDGVTLYTGLIYILSNFGLTSANGITIPASKPTGGVLLSTNSGITASGSNSQSQATLLTAFLNNVTSVALNSGVLLPIGVTPSTTIKTYNRGANILSLWPNVGQQIDTYQPNNPVGIDTGACMVVTYFGSNLWLIG